ncbi:MAG TPA: hypothetical protein VF062_15030, partial [Candidatus Limnocylindrales bacterium]
YVPHPAIGGGLVLKVAEIRRADCRGSAQVSRPETPQSEFEATCGGKVAVLWINGEKAFEGQLRLYRNGSVATEQTVAAGGIYNFQLDVADGDTIAVGGPDGPHGTYTYRQANACRAAAPMAHQSASRLPTTGVAAGSLVLGAAGLVGIGLLMRRVARRRRPKY